MSIPRFAVVLLICAGIVLFVDDQCDRITEEAGGGGELVTTTTTLTQVRSIALWYGETLGEIEAAEYQDYVTVKYEITNERWWAFRDVRTTAEMSMSGRTAAGAEVTGVRITGDSTAAAVHVYLEEPKITGFYMNRVHRFDYPGSNWQTHGERIHATTGSYFQCIALAQDKIQQKALDSGLLETARNNLEMYFRELEEIPYGTEGITVVFHWGESPVNNPENVVPGRRGPQR